MGRLSPIAGGGDMTKAVYDPNKDGIISDAQIGTEMTRDAELSAHDVLLKHGLRDTYFGVNQPYLFDDFSDNVLSGRTGTFMSANCESISTSRWILINEFSKSFPEWTVTSGTPVASAGYLSLTPDGTTEDVLQTPSNHTVGTWEYDARGITTTHGSYFVKFMWVDVNNHMEILWRNSSLTLFMLRKHVGGIFSNLIIGSFPVSSTAMHNHKITRDSAGNFELFRDGVSQGTATDNSITTSNQIVFDTQDNMVFDVQYDNIKVY